MNSKHADRVWGFNMILPHLEVGYGHEDLFSAVQDTVLSIFKAVSESQVNDIRYSTFTIWIDDSPNSLNSSPLNRRVKQWRLFIRGKELCNEVYECVSKILERRVGWSVSGWQVLFATHSIPIFKYEKGEFQVFFITENAGGDYGRVGYVDIESDGTSLKLVVVEMDATEVQKVCITGKTESADAFQVKILHAHFSGETVRFEIDFPQEFEDREQVAPHGLVTAKRDVEERRAQIFYLNNRLMLDSCIE